MRKQVSVFLAGVPSVAIPTQEWRKRQTFRIAGRKPKVPSDKLFESFAGNETGWLRGRVKAALEGSVALLRRDISAIVTDGGEFHYDAPRKFEGSSGLDEGEMAALAREFSQAASASDLAILLGGDHAGGILLYALPGKVARFDEHSDCCANPLACPRGEIARNNYVCAAVRNGFKKPEEIEGVGIREGAAFHPFVQRASGARVLDIDLDVLAEKFGIETEYGKGKLSPDDLVSAIRTNSPAAIGIFEAAKGDAKAAELVERLCVEAVAAVAKKKRR
ncbi:hypothetical protein HY995_00785 [Candidatus Micrarchaeota archaeon]|nr:hypothetical protein [Candidatus Micrarchaeota archaeon]